MWIVSLIFGWAICGVLVVAANVLFFRGCHDVFKIIFAIVSWNKCKCIYCKYFGISGCNSCIRRNKKSYSLLLSYLDAQQKIEFLSNGKFSVIGNKSGHKYTINTYGIIHNVSTFEAHYCGYPRNVQFFDLFLVQKLIIENDEETFWAKANINFL